MPTDLTSLIAPERNSYFYGLLMDADRFQKDQDYFNRKRFLLNRFVIGGGVVCGLGLTFTAGTLTLSPGIAIDLAGREIIVPAVTTIDVTQLTDAQGRSMGPAPADSPIIVSLAYAEQKIDAVPVLVPDCDHPNGCAPSTIEEDFAILVRLASGPAPSIPGCVFGSFPSAGSPLQSAIANRIASGYSPAPADASIALGRLTSGSLDAVSDRPVVYDNVLLYQLIVCLAAQVSNSTGAGAVLIYISGDNQSANSGQALTNPLVVALVDANGNPVSSGPAPLFKVISGGGKVSNVTTAGPGQYQTTWTLGTGGSQIVVAQTSQSKLPVTFQATNLGLVAL